MEEQFKIILGWQEISIIMASILTFLAALVGVTFGFYKIALNSHKAETKKINQTVESFKEDIQAVKKEMSNKVSKDAFVQYEKRIEESLGYIKKDIDGISEQGKETNRLLQEINTKLKVR